MVLVHTPMREIDFQALEQRKTSEHIEPPIKNQTSSDEKRFFLHYGYEDDVLIEGWDADTDWHVAAVVAAAFFISVLFEFVRCSRHRLMIHGASQTKYKSWTIHVISSIMYGIQAAIGIILILLICTFHLWICVGIAAGLAVGCLCFSLSTVQVTFNVHQRYP